MNSRFVQIILFWWTIYWHLRWEARILGMLGCPWIILIRNTGNDNDKDRSQFTLEFPCESHILWKFEENYRIFQNIKESQVDASGLLTLIYWLLSGHHIDELEEDLRRIAPHHRMIGAHSSICLTQSTTWFNNIYNSLYSFIPLDTTKENSMNNKPQ